MSSPAPTASRHVSCKASQFTESVIREMTREAMKYGAVNLSQGYPDFPAPADIKRVAMQAIAAYENYLRLAPNGSQASAIRSIVDQLKSQQTD